MHSRIRFTELDGIRGVVAGVRFERRDRRVGRNCDCEYEGPEMEIVLTLRTRCSFFPSRSVSAWNFGSRMRSLPANCGLRRVERAIVRW